MSTLESIVEELKTLPPPKLAEAAALIHGLRAKGRSERLASLERSAGILSEAEGAALERVIEEGWPAAQARGSTRCLLHIVGRCVPRAFGVAISGLTPWVDSRCVG